MGAFFYNTNGFAHHRIDDALRVLSQLGYDGVAWTPDVHHLHPGRSSDVEIDAFGALCKDLGLSVIVETGARFVLDPMRKHRPSLLDEAPGAAERLAFLEQCVACAARVNAPVVSVWAGNGPPDLAEDTAMARLVKGLRRLCETAAGVGVRVGFEPEPGMLVDRTDGWPALRDRVDHPALGLTLDVGHVVAMEEGDPADAIRAHARDLLVLHLDDHRPGCHEHLAFGEGVLDFGRVAAAVRDVGFQGPLEVELSRHSASAPATAREALAFLHTAFMDSGRSDSP